MDPATITALIVAIGGILTIMFNPKLIKLFLIIGLGIFILGGSMVGLELPTLILVFGVIFLTIMLVFKKR